MAKKRKDAYGSSPSLNSPASNGPNPNMWLARPQAFGRWVVGLQSTKKSKKKKGRKAADTEHYRLMLPPKEGEQTSRKEK